MEATNSCCTSSRRAGDHRTKVSPVDPSQAGIRFKNPTKVCACASDNTGPYHVGVKER